MEISETLPDTYNEGYVHPLQPEPAVAEALSLKISSHGTSLK